MTLYSRFANRQSSIVNRKSDDGMALVITLILISVITFLAITFLAVSRRERNAVTILTDQTTARLAADAAVERAKAELLVPMLANTNAQLSSLLVSMNYFNRPGFASGVADITNVNYDHMLSGSPLFSQDDFRQNIANLLYSPRVPVFVSTNTDKSRPLDFRFYLDLNRNKRFDTNGFLPIIDDLGQTNGATNFVGDPEWIGILEKPDQPHSSTNRFVARYAYVAIPAGKTLDLNYIHNYARRRDFVMSPGQGDGFVRNQGVGTWEVNLAAFLADLNTNQWEPLPAPYDYNTSLGQKNTGLAFDDALSLLRYRYGGDFRSLQRASDIFGGSALSLQTDGIDQYSDGNLYLTNTPPDNDTISVKWAGSDNTNHFFTTQDFFDPAKARLGVAPNNDGFPERLQNASAGVSSYNRYTYYRMLSQLGTDSAPEKDKININYTNGIAFMDAYGVATGMAIIPNLVTNLGQWSPTQFFTMAADKLLRTYSTNWFNTAPADYLHTFFNINTNGLTNMVDVVSVAREYGLINNSGEVVVPGFGVTNIPVWVSNKFVYTPSVHRLLQLAANIYDATTNDTPAGMLPVYPHLPHVFRPLFKRETTNGYINVYVTGYEEVKDVAAGDAVLNVPVEARTLAETVLGSGYSTGSSDGLITPTPNVYNVPWIIGAKKGFPNFNKYSMQNATTVTRRLEFRHFNWVSGDPDDPSNPVAYTNQLYSVGVTNAYGVEAWNSYTNNYSRSLQVSARNELTIVFFGTNSIGQEVILASNLLAAVRATNIAANMWTGITNDIEGNAVFPTASFVVPLETNFVFLGTNYGFLQSSAGFNGVVGDFQNVGNNFPIPRWWVKLSARMRYILLDNSAGAGSMRVVDYASLSRDEDPVDVTYRLAGQVAIGNTLDSSENGGWYTNRLGGNSPSSPTVGIMNQILMSLGQIPVDWNSYTYDQAAGQDKSKAVQFFKINFGQLESTPELQKSNVFFAPYAPIRTIYQHVSWQANDPLVHYTVPDLTDPALNTVDYKAGNPVLKDIRGVNTRYKPWGATDKGQSSILEIDSNPANKDPLVYQSDNWDFPTNKFPNVGWLGRVHRGTPWQSVFMKAADVDPNLDNIFWRKWSGDMDPGDAVRTKPVEDRMLFDLFTTAINDNATRGQLSVNQSGLAAWSAVLSGVITFTNSASDAPVRGDKPILDPFVIAPAGLGGNSAPVARIVQAINDVRATNTLLFPDHSFHHVGDVLAVPELTVDQSRTNGSPFLNLFDQDMRLHGISEAVYERIPQQIMSLLRLDDAPRFVIYAYGQALSPAPRSIITSGSYFGMSTNYQVTAETAVRAVVRVDGAPVAGTTGIATPHLVVESFNVLGPD